MRSPTAPTEPDLAHDELGHQDLLDGDGDATSSGFILFSLGPAQPDV